MNCAAKTFYPAAAWLVPAVVLAAPAVWAQSATAESVLQAQQSLPEAPSPAGDARWVLGATLASTPAYGGAAARKLSLRPVVAGRVGRWMVSSSSARAMANMDLAGGISTTLMASDRWTVGAGLRLTHGRSSAADPMLSGMEPVSSSLALRGVVGYAFSPQWRATVNVQHDLLHGQGTRANLGLGWSQPVGGGWTLNAGGGLTWASARAAQTFYGVSPAEAQAARPAWQAGAGLESWGLGVGVSRVLSTHWRVAGNIGRSTLLGDAARSPLTQQRGSNTASVTLAYVGR